MDKNDLINSNQSLNNFLSQPLPQNFTSRYFQHWKYRWGMIPNIPINTDNSNSIYELLAWLQRGFKNLLDDFLELELEFEQFKNELIYMLEIVIPEIIREYVKTKEFQEIINNYIKEWFEKNVEERLKTIENNIKELQDKTKELENRINDIQNQIDEINKKIDDILKTLEGLLGGGYKKLTKDKDYQVVFHNAFYTEANDMTVGVIELTDRYIVKFYSSYSDKTALLNKDLVNNFELKHGSSINDKPKSLIMSFNFIGDYADINSNSSIISSGGSGLMNVRPINARATWNMDFGVTRNHIDNYPFTITGNSYADGYNTNFSIYGQPLSLYSGNFGFNMTILKSK